MFKQKDNNIFLILKQDKIPSLHDIFKLNK